MWSITGRPCTAIANNRCLILRTISSLIVHVFVGPLFGIVSQSLGILGRPLLLALDVLHLLAELLLIRPRLSVRLLKSSLASSWALLCLYHRTFSTYVTCTCYIFFIEEPCSCHIFLHFSSTNILAATLRTPASTVLTVSSTFAKRPHRFLSKNFHLNLQHVQLGATMRVPKKKPCLRQ